MKDSNDYYALAINDLIYLQHSLDLPLYNNIAVMAQQVVEKLLKSVAERTCLEIDKLMHSHNLRGLYTEIHKNVTSFELDKGALSILKDMYFDAKYPGENYVVVDKETCIECLQIMYDTLKQVNKFRTDLQLECFDYKELYLIEENSKEFNSF